jgi:hypothetical protein
MDAPREIISEGYTRDRHWEYVYHDTVDLYGPKIGLDGIGLWFAYKRFVQHNPDHLLVDKAWPSHRGLLAPLFRVGQDSLSSARRRLEKAGLITVTSGAQLVARSHEEYQRQMLIWQDEGKPRSPVRRIAMKELVALGIKNPRNTLFVDVNDPLPILSFCEKFNLTCKAEFRYGQWEMVFSDDYPGLIRGPNRLMVAARYIEDNLDVEPVDRPYNPMLTEEQIRSLLRCKPDDNETPIIRSRLIQRRAKLVGEPSPGMALPENILLGLRNLGWRGDTAEIEVHFRENPQRVVELLTHALTASLKMHDGEKTVKNPAALFRDLLREDEALFGPPDIEEIPY